MKKLVSITEYNERMYGLDEDGNVWWFGENKKVWFPSESMNEFKS